MSNAPLPPEEADFFGQDMDLSEMVKGILDLVVSNVGDRRLGRALVDLGNLLAPQELTKVYQTITEKLTDASRQRVARLAPQWNHFLSRGGKVYRREQLWPGVMLYRSAAEGAVRPAMVCFTSKRAGLFMPNCRFLELIGRHPVDVVILTSDTGTFGDWSLCGSRSFHDSLATLKAELAGRGIRPSLYLGASAGGGPAVIAAMLDGRASGIMFGGRFYWPGRKIPLSRAGSAFEPLCACWQGPRVPLHSIFGANMAWDAENTRRLSRLMPHLQANPIPNDDKHSPMATLAARQKLRPVVDLIVQAAAGKPVNFDLVRMP